jgi:hypothetical protein
LSSRPERPDSRAVLLNCSLLLYVCVSALVLDVVLYAASGILFQANCLAVFASASVSFSKKASLAAAKKRTEKRLAAQQKGRRAKKRTKRK